ncbi:MAG: lipoyl(octanoyl) transferase LipB [Bdellovibrionaceae bacterium]|nr:lipoyl(octanoyl) transferase LipB [Pseudobdellovibrionaceae bacterium]
MNKPEIVDWGLIEYEKALRKQEDLVNVVAETREPGYIVFCKHPPVVTLGRSTREGDVTSWRGPTLTVSRGGRATYHGPNQIIVYPIINLDKPRNGRPPRDIVSFLRDLEQSIIDVLAEYGLKGHGKSLLKEKDPLLDAEMTGVWVDGRKVASLGIAIRKWVSYHGLAVNLHKDPQAFQGLKPCGFTPETMISLEELLGHPIPEEEFKKKLGARLLLKQ